VAKNYTVEEVAEILRISTNKAYDLIRDGELRSFRIGRAIRVPEIALEDFVGKEDARLERQPA
jgi:putative molybdopterin biosynthesis protein